MFYEEYQVAAFLQPTDELDVYCQSEGLDALHIRSAVEQERKRQRKVFGRGARNLRVEGAQFPGHEFALEAQSICEKH